MGLPHPLERVALRWKSNSDQVFRLSFNIEVLVIAMRIALSA